MQTTPVPTYNDDTKSVADPGGGKGAMPPPGV